MRIIDDAPCKNGNHRIVVEIEPGEKAVVGLEPTPCPTCEGFGAPVWPGDDSWCRKCDGRGFVGETVTMQRLAIAHREQGVAPLRYLYRLAAPAATEEPT